MVGWLISLRSQIQCLNCLSVILNWLLYFHVNDQIDNVLPFAAINWQRFIWMAKRMHWSGSWKNIFQSKSNASDAIETKEKNRNYIINYRMNEHCLLRHAKCYFMDKIIENSNENNFCKSDKSASLLCALNNRKLSELLCAIDNKQTHSMRWFHYCLS